jgi:hypothetical protein
MRRFTLAAAAVWLTGSTAMAAITYSGGDYTQNFNGLPSTAGSTTLSGNGPHDIEGVLSTTGMTGWTMANIGGSTSAVEFKVHNGSLSGSSGRGVVSYGTDEATDRALGFLPTSNQINAAGLSFVNNTGSTLAQFTLTYTGEQWRRGNVESGNTLTFGYLITDSASDNIVTGTFSPVAALDFASPNVQTSPTEVAIDGNLSGNRTTVSYTVKNLDWQPNETLILRWLIVELSGQDDGLAIDDLAFSAIPEPMSLMLLASGVLVMVSGRRKH